MTCKSCVDCVKIVYYILHIATGVECCTVHANSATIDQVRQIESSVNNLIDPCNDFYAHACGNWEELHRNTSYDEVTGFVDYKLNKRLINIVETAYQHPHQVTEQCQSFVEKTRIYYKSCLKEKARNVSRYFEHIKPSESLEWPLMEELQAYKRNDINFKLDEWPANKLDVFALLGKLQGYGLNNVLISQEIARSANGSLQIMLELPYVAVNDEVPSEVFMVHLIGWGLPEATAYKYAKNLVVSQKRWHEIYQNYSQTVVDDADNRVKLKYGELGLRYPQLFTFLQNLLPQQIQPDDYVVVANLDYFEFLLNKQWLPKEPQFLTNYLMMKFLAYLLQDTTNDFTPLDCIKDLRNKMDLAVNYLYYENVYWRMHSTFDDIDQFSMDIVHYFKQTLCENHLKLNDQQLKQLIHKIETIFINLGNLPRNLQCSQIEEFYKDVPALETRNYYNNHLKLLAHRFQKSLLYTQGQTFFVASDNRVGSSSAPIYIPKQHMVILPLGFLQSPIYDYSYHPLFKWSMLGFLLAHELTHAIDTTGQLYGVDGHMLSQYPSVLENSNFTAALECMLAQQPTDAIDERLADLVGARVAYKAYVKHYPLQPQSANIPWKKLFFLNMAQFFCGRKDVKFVDHDADAVRLREIVKNLDGFAEAFQCRVGTPMNPEKKCRLY